MNKVVSAYSGRSDVKVEYLPGTLQYLVSVKVGGDWVSSYAESISNCDIFIGEVLSGRLDVSKGERKDCAKPTQEELDIDRQLNGARSSRSVNHGRRGGGRDSYTAYDSASTAIATSIMYAGVF